MGRKRLPVSNDPRVELTREKVRANSVAYRLANKEKCAAAAVTAWRLANPERCAAMWRRFYEEKRAHNIKRSAERNKAPSVKAAHADWRRKKRLTDPQQNAKDRVYQAISRIFDGSRPTKRYVTMLGCTKQEFFDHISSKWAEGMTWENRGKGQGKWQVDHIRPAVKFDLLDPSQLAEFFHYTNTQPLWARENPSKGVHESPRYYSFSPSEV